MRHIIIVILTIISVITSDPIIIKSSLNKDHAKKEDASVHDASSVKGISNYEGEEGFNLNNENKVVKAQDTGKFNEQNSEKKIHEDDKNFADERFQQKGGNEVANFGKKVAHKKGHHKSGFTKSYHKDESENNSSYYDDAEDQGDEHIENNHRNSYGDAAQSNRRGQDYDNKRYENDQAKKGYYDNAGNYERGLANQKDYRAKKYNDEKENLGRRNSGNQYGEQDRYEEEKYYKKPHYYHQQPYDYEDSYYSHGPHHTLNKKTITVYEDPRYDDGREYERYPRYDSDYVQLDFRQPIRDYPDYRYNDRRPSFDYYYY